MADPQRPNGGANGGSGASSNPFPSSPPSTQLLHDQMELGERPSPTLPVLNSSIPPLNPPVRALDPQTSSDPLFNSPFSLDFADSHRHPIRKRKAPTPLHSDQQHIDKEPRTQNTQSSAREAILQARDLLVQAYSLTSSRTEQSQLLDLLEVFREYTEKGRLQSASTIIASQIANLEATTRKIETKARALAKAPVISSNTRTSGPPGPPGPPGTTGTTGTGTTPSFASIASLGPNTTKSPSSEDWILVGNKSKAKEPSKNYSTIPKQDKSRRLILIRSVSSSADHFSSLALRNAFNKAF